MLQPLPDKAFGDFDKDPICTISAEPAFELRDFDLGLHMTYYDYI